MKYAVIFEQGPTSVGAVVPDLPGCFAVGENMTEAKRLVAEAIGIPHPLPEDSGDPIPAPSHHAEDIEVAA